MSEVIYEKRGHIAHIKLNRPERFNAMSRSMAIELRKTWIDFRDDSELCGRQGDEHGDVGVSADRNLRGRGLGIDCFE